ncbi:hypothetical protein [Streptomyces sp. NBC_00887]|uniref:hypothetical protein n=1 Tax=Streptomyces sp. NBC_00887 TaxID=2975859 RepID=UPI00386E65FA|nr:hypothetical protein OG844_11185 [Streptomyces sp. NBC_00887]
MGLYMSWEVSGIASAGGDVRDIAGALKALNTSVERIQERVGLSPSEQRSLNKSAAEVRSRVLTDGSAAVEKGRSYSIVIGEVRLSLQPTEDTV